MIWGEPLLSFVRGLSGEIRHVAENMTERRGSSYIFVHKNLKILGRINENELHKNAESGIMIRVRLRLYDLKVFAEQNKISSQKISRKRAGEKNLP